MGELTVDLHAPGMTPLHRAGAAGLYMAEDGNFSLGIAASQIGRPEALIATVAHEQQAVARDRALVHAEDAHLAHVGVHRHLEHMREHVHGRIGPGLHGHGRLALAVEEIGRVALGRVRQQLDDHVQQFGHTGAGARRDEAHGDQVPFAQRLLQRRVQFRCVDVAIVQVTIDERRVHLHHLLDQRAVRVLDRAEVGVTLAVVEAVDIPVGALACR